MRRYSCNVQKIYLMIKVLAEVTYQVFSFFYRSHVCLKKFKIYLISISFIINPCYAINCIKIRYLYRKPVLHAQMLANTLLIVLRTIYVFTNCLYFNFRIYRIFYSQFRIYIYNHNFIKLRKQNMYCEWDNIILQYNSANIRKSPLRTVKQTLITKFAV